MQKPLLSHFSEEGRERANYQRNKMMKGVSSFGKRCNETHTVCRRCGSKAHHLQKPPAKHMRKYNWNAKAKR
ncbi:hypothetical protein U0070_024628 [Myodes glareolus]|uniref:60S ribosomal protein L37 n=1 Tax=Myodes glareolus TaxID=447135 RepID=A0AAW0JY19_MYOGA